MTHESGIPPELDRNEAVSFFATASEQDIRAFAEKDGWADEELERVLGLKASFDATILGEDTNDA